MRVRASHIASVYYLDACERVELDESDGRHLPLDELPPFTHAGNGGRWWRQILYDVQERRRPLDEFSTQHGKRDIEEKLRRETDELILIKNEHFNAEKYPPQPAKPQYIRCVLNSCAQRIASEFCSHLRTNFFARQRAAHAAFLIRLGPEAIPNAVVRNVLFHTIRRVNGRRPGTEPSPRDVENQTEFERLGDDAKAEINAFVDGEREALALFRGSQDWLTPVSLEDESSPRMARLLIWSYRALRRLEEFHESGDMRRRAGALRLRVRLFTLFPQARIGKTHIGIDASAFYEIGCGAKLWGGEKVKMKEYGRRRFAKLARWRTVFNLAPLLKRGRRDRCLNFSLQTDGVAVSMLFRRAEDRPGRHWRGPIRVDPVKDNSEKARDVLRRARQAPADEFNVERTRVIAIDPGRRDLVHAVERVRAPAPPRAPTRAGGAGPRAPPRPGAALPAPAAAAPPAPGSAAPPAPGSAAPPAPQPIS
jgi:hypothetical protein